MGKIIVSQNVTLDGVMEDPTGDAGFRHGGWFEEMSATDREQWADVEFAEAKQAAALLLGRGSDTFFGTRWNSQTSEWAQRLNALPKYVISSTITEPVWTNSTVVSGDVVEEVTDLKGQIDGEIVVYASRPLVHTLLENELVDEIRLFVFPVIAGEGERVFGALRDKHRLRRVDLQPVGEGLVHLTYQVVP
ncbi:MAG: dihydrofolate reductase family protein [Jatrophihabitantaceae bacterium]